jgi:hypothetical protein
MTKKDRQPQALGRQAFWAQPPALPEDLRLTQLETIVAPRRGRGGEAVFDLARLQTPSASVVLVISFRSPASAQDVLTAKRQLTTIIEDLRLRAAGSGRGATTYVPTFASDVVPKSILEACVREGLAVLDRRGTIIAHQGPLFVHVEGRATVDRPSRIRIFSGRACRVVRFVLAHPGVRLKPQEVASGTQTSYAFTHGVLTKLERNGYLNRPSPRAGFRLRDGTALLRAWIDSGERTAVQVTPYFAPNTRPEALARAVASAREHGVGSIFTLASALEPGQVFASGLPHGAYVAGDTTPFEETLQLQRVTPHNFWILRADPASESTAGGLYAFKRTLPHGDAVALPQLAVDFAISGGRGKEQADHLLSLFAKSLPPPELDE